MPSKLAQKATKLMEAQRGHCAQAIFTTFGEDISGGKVDFDTCMKISAWNLHKGKTLVMGTSAHRYYCPRRADRKRCWCGT
ncbi:MAG: hypothetical protein GF309_11630 [Candidatus Lokiarchaeota archaeon]|nr:hypothetical protein [Candidatus Lokiarchaeota archaeon]